MTGVANLNIQAVRVSMPNDLFDVLMAMKASNQRGHIRLTVRSQLTAKDPLSGASFGRGNAKSPNVFTSITKT